MRAHTLLSLMTLSAILISPAVADTQIKFSSTDEHAPESIYISAGKIYLHDGESKVIIAPAAREMTIINDSDKEYMVVDEAFFEGMGKMASAMQDMMKSLPPGMMDQIPESQRAALLGASGAKPLPKTELIQLGSKQTISSVPCVDHKVMSDGEQQATACIADAKDTGMNMDDYKTLQELPGFAGHIQQQLAASFPDLANNVDMNGLGAAELPGVPMQVLSDGDRYTIDSISSETVDLSQYSISGYKKIDTSEMFEGVTQ